MLGTCVLALRYEKIIRKFYLNRMQNQREQTTWEVCYFKQILVFFFIQLFLLLRKKKQQKNIASRHVPQEIHAKPELLIIRFFSLTWWQVTPASGLTWHQTDEALITSGTGTTSVLPRLLSLSWCVGAISFLCMWTRWWRKEGLCIHSSSLWRMVLKKKHSWNIACSLLRY